MLVDYQISSSLLILSIDFLLSRLELEKIFVDDIRDNTGETFWNNSIDMREKHAKKNVFTLKGLIKTQDQKVVWYHEIV